MFFQLLFIHLFRPFLKYKPNSTPLPAHVSPRKFLTHAASMISKLLRLYKRTHSLRQICNIVVYITHSACTIHLLNLPDKNAARDIVHGLKHLEEIAESWLCARRTLAILHRVTRRWNIEVPEEAGKTFIRTEAKFGGLKDNEASPKLGSPTQPLPPPVVKHHVDSNFQQSTQASNGANEIPNDGFFGNTQLSKQASATNSSSTNGTLSMQSQPAVNFTTHPQQPQYVMPQAQQPQAQQPPRQQQNVWNRNPTTSAPPPTTSPTMLFGGVDSLIQDQEWWLRDSNQMFANWNGMENEAVIQGNSGFDLGTGNMGYGNTAYGLNGMNGNGNGNGNLGFPR